MIASVACQACGYDKNPVGAEFCDACGSVLPTSSAGTPESSQFDSSPEPPLETTVFQSPDSISVPPTIIPPVTPPVASQTARLVARQAGAPLPEFLIGSNAIVGIFDPDMGPVEVDLEGFQGDETVSRNHAEIYQEGGTWKIKDLGSTNGIFIKPVGQTRFGARITAPQGLNSGDEIAIAKVRFLFQSP